MKHSGLSQKASGGTFSNQQILFLFLFYCFVLFLL